MLRIIPLTLTQANAYIKQYHRHHKPVRGHRFSLGAINGDSLLVGVCVVGRPVARMVDAYRVAEVTRLCTDGSKNCCSFLYSAAARVAREMGFDKIQTYILETETGASLRAAGWEYEETTAGGQWKHTAGPRRTDQPTCAKKRYCRIWA